VVHRFQQDPSWLCDLKLALVINFGERLVRQGIHRVVNGLQE